MCTHHDEPGAGSPEPNSRRTFLVQAVRLVPLTAATALTLNGAADPVIAAPPFQDDWARCLKCDVMFFNGYPANKGVCPAQGQHVAEKLGRGPRKYRLAYDDSTGPGQGDWRFCRKCFALFFSYYPTRGACPVDDKGHDAAGYNFFLHHDRPAGVNEEPHWRYCRNCQGLFRTANVTASVCPANGARHLPAGYHFVVGQPGQCIDEC